MNIIKEKKMDASIGIQNTTGAPWRAKQLMVCITRAVTLLPSVTLPLLFYVVCVCVCV